MAGKLVLSHDSEESSQLILLWRALQVSFYELKQLHCELGHILLLVRVEVRH